jgi:Tfp pilus assembly protein PilO
MAALINKLLKMFPMLLFLYTALGVYTWYEGVQSKQIEIANQKKAVELKIKKDKDWLAGIQEFMDNIDKQEQQVEEVKQKIGLVQRQLPSDVSDTEILEFLSREAEVMNLQNVSLEPKEEVLNGFYFAKQFELKAEGTFHQFLVFFERMSDAERLFNVKQLSLTPSKNSRFRGRFQMIELYTIIESFRYNTNYKEGDKETKVKGEEKGKTKK